MEVTAIAKSSLATLINPEDDRVLVSYNSTEVMMGSILLSLLINTMLYPKRGEVSASGFRRIKISDSQGFHVVNRLWSLYKNGQMAVVQKCRLSQSKLIPHFRSTDIWTTASDSNNTFQPDGWADTDLNYPGYPEGCPNAENPDPFCNPLGFVVSRNLSGPIFQLQFYCQ